MAKRKYICPNCGKKTGADILYGYPAWELVKQDVEEGYLVIGGCCLPIDGPERECTECGHQWRIKRRKPDPMTQFDTPPNYFRLDIGGWPDMPAFVEWRNDQLITGQYPAEGTLLERITPKRWAAFWQGLLISGVDIWSWKASYTNPDVCDGASWTLTIEQDGHRKTIQGANAYPDCNDPDPKLGTPFHEFLKRLRGLTGNKALR